eukprot:TRINITY_DN2255_c0_g1_i1.p1 TRINITY_DN2255_c0_g1~~TRINITY_DN2255_c0_g1_i1.p1  ORF type:complete len:333 (+),score=15.40 TRINITY_DN2255_c0_g1_i1:65-1063(+)
MAFNSGGVVYDGLEAYDDLIDEYDFTAVQPRQAKATSHAKKQSQIERLPPAETCDPLAELRQDLLSPGPIAACINTKAFKVTTTSDVPLSKEFIHKLLVYNYRQQPTEFLSWHKYWRSWTHTHVIPRSVLQADTCIFALVDEHTENPAFHAVLPKHQLQESELFLPSSMLQKNVLKEYGPNVTWSDILQTKDTTKDGGFTVILCAHFKCVWHYAPGHRLQGVVEPESCSFSIPPSPPWFGDLPHIPPIPTKLKQDHKDSHKPVSERDTTVNSAPDLYVPLLFACVNDKNAPQKADAGVQLVVDVDGTRHHPTKEERIKRTKGMAWQRNEKLP